jgi:class 3 adenylate cyclase/predicted ATPase
MQQIANWLKKLGMSEYADRFAENHIDITVLSELSDQHLKDLGVSLGHRLKMLRAIRELADVALTKPQTAATATASSKDGAERRQLTVVFCDLVGSTALSTRLGPEEMRAIIGVYHRCVADTVAQLDGFVAKYMGDGVLVYFGYPRAHEDDAERAVRAGLELAAAVPRLQTGAATKLQARIGIATGLVGGGDLLTSGEGRERGVIGETPNLAARLQTLAEPSAVIIAQSTRRLVGGFFECRDLGAVEAKGSEEPVQAYQVLRVSTIERRFEALHPAARTPLVGREEEIELLLRRWRRAKGHEGQVVLLSGEPGIGKSRIATIAQERIASDPHIRFRYFSSSYHVNSTLYPVIHQLEREAGFQRDDPPEMRRNKLEALLAPASPSATDVALFAELLSLPAAATSPSLSLSPQRKRRKTGDALLRRFESLARQWPIVMVFEDIHWLDPTSRELLDVLIERAKHIRVLLIVTFRPEFQPPWTGQAHVTTLALNRLDPREGAALARSVAGNAAALSTEVVAEIVDRTGGIPLFVEELTKAVLEAGASERQAKLAMSEASLPRLAIPATLHASLLARLDRLGPAKDVAQIGATIGREFSYELLAAVAELSETTIQAALDQLVGAGLLFRRGSLPDATFIFKHALVQDAAYGTLLKSSRQYLHGRIARMAEGRFADLTAAQPTLVAHHYEHAGLANQAIDYWEKAGELAVWRSAMAEAAAHFTRALDLLCALPESAQRKRKELALQLSLAGALTVTKGWASPQMGKTYTRARDLAIEVGEILSQVSALFGLFLFHHNGGAINTGRQVAQQLLALAERHGDRDATLLGQRAAGVSCVFQAKFADALAYLEKGWVQYDPMRHRPSIAGAIDAHVACASFAAWTLLFQGHPDRALVQSQQALVYARPLSHPHALAFALHVNCLFQQIWRDGETLVARSEELVALTAEQGFPHLLASGMFFRSWARLATGGVTEKVISEMRRALAMKQATGAEIKVPYFLGLLAEAHLKANKAREALRLVKTALARVNQTGERWFEAELYRLQGEALRRSPESDETEASAEACFRRALAVARDQGARLWELRATIGLAQIWRDHGKRQHAHDLLAPVYGWFTEGFDTLDLKQAKILLDELAS